MLIVTDEKAARISRKCGLSSSRKTKEEGNIAVLDTDIGRRMKRKLTKFNWL